MAVDVRAPLPRWRQLTYTCADDIAGTKGGWGIKETSPGMDETTSAILREGVTTALREIGETPQFPNQADLAARTRRLMFRDQGALALWHAVAAGVDATGRPGNVYTHAAALAVDDPTVRPIDYWRSEDWLTPHGATAVTASRLGADLRPGTVIDRAAMVDFADEQRFVLEWLASALASVDASGETLVVATADADEAARWIGALTYLTAPPTGRRISWVTFERGRRVREGALRDLRIVGVPRDDLEDLLAAPPRGTLVVDPLWALEPVDGVFTTPADQTFALDTAWQTAILDPFAEGDITLVHQLLERMDALATHLPRADLAAVPLHWPLLVAMLSDEQLGAAAEDDTIFTCLKEAPASALKVPAVMALAVRALSPGSPAEWSEFVPGAPMGPVPAIVAQVLSAKHYLATWRDSTVAPTVTPQAKDWVKEALAAEIATAIADAALQVMADDQLVAKAAVVLSFILTAELDPPPPSDDEASAIAKAIDVLKVRIRPDVVAGLVLHPMLAPASLPSARPASAPARQVPQPSAGGASVGTAARAPEGAEWSTRHSPADPQRTVLPPAVHPPVVPAAGSSRSAPEPVVPAAQLPISGPGSAPPLVVSPLLAPAPVTAPVAPQSGRSDGAAGFDSVLAPLLQMTMEASRVPTDQVNRARREGLVVAVLAHVGVRSLDPSGHVPREEEARALAWLGASTGLASEYRDVVVGWLGAVWAVREVRLARDEPGVPALTTEIRLVNQATAGAVIDQLVRMLHQVPVDLAAQVASTALRRNLLVPTASVLGIPMSNGPALGWEATTRAVQGFSSERTRNFHVHFDPEAEMVRRDLPDRRVAETVAALSPVAAPDEILPEHSRKRRRN